MGSIVAEWALGLVGTAVVGLVVWVWALWRDHGELSRTVSGHIGRSFTRADLDTVVERASEPIRRDISELRSLLIDSLNARR